MRKKKAIINIIFSVLLEAITITSGFIIPRLIIGSFGSSVNGLVNSITSFTGYISVLQLGVGSVIKASLYKPLAKGNQDLLNTIVTTTSKYFRKIGVITITYIAILTFVFPALIVKDFEFLYTASLVGIIGISTIFTYMYGITYQMLFEADQRAYVFSITQIITVILNTVVTVILIKFGASIHIVKAASACFFLLRPLALNIYANRLYKLNHKVPIDNSVITQRWDGFAQGLAYYIYSKTDIFVLTIFSSLTNVSIYSVYALITTGLNALTNSIDKAVRAAFGNILANDEDSNLKKSFDTYNTCIHILCTILFATASITVFRFITVYIGSIKDADYYKPVFGILILGAEYLNCLRMPYNSIIFAAGKFKETKKSAFIEAGLNLIVSCSLVFNFGLIGVAIGTVVAVVYRTASFVIFLHDNILNLSYLKQIKRYGVTLISYATCVFAFSRINITVIGYLDWAVYAVLICTLTSVIVFLMNVIFYRKNIIYVFRGLFSNNLIKKD